MRTAIIIQARMGSSRLPNKMTKVFYNGKGLLEILLDRLINQNINVPIILATTDNKIDDAITDLVEKKGIVIFRGDENNVLKRIVDAAIANNVEKIIRICADNPFIDINMLKKMINSFEKADNDYWCYSVKGNKPTIITHFGFWGEGVTLEALLKILAKTNRKKYLEHVTNYIYTNPEDFNISYNEISNIFNENMNIRLTIDTENDFIISKEIFEEFIKSNIGFEAENIIKFVLKNKHWYNQMKIQIEQNEK